MEATARCETDELIQSLSEDESNGSSTSESAGNKIQLLKQLTFRLLNEMQSLSEVRTLNIESGLDFYDEVSRFEIDLITRALLRTGGHQIRAARLLNLKVTTLNSKIKHYKIRPEVFVQGPSFVDANELETRQTA